MKGTLNGIIDIGHGQHLLTIQTDDSCLRINKLKDKIIDFTINEYTPKRSKDANSYLWVICDKIAHAVGTSSVEVYRDAVKQAGQSYLFNNLTEKEYTSFNSDWSRLGTGWPTEVLDYTPDGDHLLVRAYRGSSTYNKDEMKLLTDCVVCEAKNLDIETDTARITSLLNDWDNKRGY